MSNTGVTWFLITGVIAVVVGVAVAGVVAGFRRGYEARRRSRTQGAVGQDIRDLQAADVDDGGDR